MPTQTQPTSASTDWLDASALEQARAIRERRVSSEELVRGYLARIVKHNPSLNAFVDFAPLFAPRWARRKDLAQRRSRELPPFHGVPIGIKDLSLVRGFYARFGARSFKHHWAVLDDRTVMSLRRAGFVIIGKLATSEAGAMPITEPDIHPPTRNPWHLEHSPGGSSGGSAAAVAAGLLPLAHGTDGAGSIRIPAAFCGLFGFKPSRGRVKNPYGLRDPRMLYTCGPLTRGVDDAAALLDAMTNGERPMRSFLSAAAITPKPLRVRFTVKSPIGDTHPEHADATLAVVKLLEAAGHHVEQGPDFVLVLDDFLPLWQVLIAAAPLLRSKMQPVTRWLVDGAKHVDRRSLGALHDRLARTVDETFGDVDIWVTPAVPVPPPRIGEHGALPPAETFERVAVLGGFTAPFNLTGQPAASIPAGFSRAGLPIGVQIVGRRGEDGLVLALAKQLEQLQPTAARRPPPL